jgi:hypothetical protein
MSQPGRRAPASPQEPNACILVGCMIGGLPLVGLLVVGFYVGVEVFAQRLVSLVPEQVLAGLMGGAFLLLGVSGVYGVATGRGAEGSSRSARLLALIVCIGLGLFGLLLLTLLLDPSDPQTRF